MRRPKGKVALLTAPLPLQFGGVKASEPDQDQNSALLRDIRNVCRVRAAYY